MRLLDQRPTRHTVVMLPDFEDDTAKLQMLPFTQNYILRTHTVVACFLIKSHFKYIKAMAKVNEFRIESLKNVPGKFRYKQWYK